MKSYYKDLFGLGISLVGFFDGFSKEYKNDVFILADDMGTDFTAEGVKSV